MATCSLNRPLVQVVFARRATRPPRVARDEGHASRATSPALGIASVLAHEPRLGSPISSEHRVR